MAIGNINATTPIGKVRLKVGDINEKEYFLDDATYQTFLDEANGNVLKASIKALTTIINYIALSPLEWRIGEASETTASVTALEKRLQELRKELAGGAVPVIINPGNRKWQDDFNKLWGN